MLKNIVCYSILLLLYGNICHAISIISWNIQDLGGTKNNAEIAFVAQVVKDFDIVAIQEVVAKDPKGAQAVALLADQLNRTGAKWDYRVSDPTQSPSSYISERYAFVWKTSNVSLQGRPRLIHELNEVCDREPYYARFMEGEYQYDIINFHSRPHNKDPESEVMAISQMILANQENYNWIIAGDFNLSEQEDVWQPLYKAKYKPAINNQKTTIKRSCNNGEYLNYPIDNIYYNRGTNVKRGAGVRDIVGSCDKIEMARKISDHLPVWINLN